MRLADRLNRARVRARAPGLRWSSRRAARAAGAASRRRTERAGSSIRICSMKRVTRCWISLMKRSLLRVDVLVAAGTVEIARFQRQLVHEARQKARLVDRRQVLRNCGFPNRCSLRLLARIISGCAAAWQDARRRGGGPRGRAGRRGGLVESRAAVTALPAAARQAGKKSIGLVTVIVPTSGPRSGTTSRAPPACAPAPDRSARSTRLRSA